MATGGAVSDLNRYGGVVDKVSAQAIRDLDRIDAATKGIGNMDAATASMVKLADETAKTALTAARELNRIERAGEAMASALERQVSVFGKTGAEVRQMKADAAALAAEQAGMTELAKRIRELEADLHGAELAAFRKEEATRRAAEEDRDAARAAKEAQAEIDRLSAATERATLAAQERTAAERTLISQLAERAQIDAALERNTGLGRVRATDAGATFSALAAQAADEDARAQTAAAAATQRNADEHGRLSALVNGSHDAQMADAAAAERLRQSTDPLYAATKLLNGEIAESTRLYHAGATAPEEYARQQTVLAQRLREMGQLHEQSATGIGKNNFALKQTAIQIPDIVQGLLTGQKPLTIFIQQGGQIAQIAQMAEGGIAGFSRQLGALALRFAPVIIGATAATAIVSSMFVSFKDQVSDRADLDAYVKTLGLTHDELKRLGPVSVTAGDMLHGLVKTIGLDLDGVGDTVHKAIVNIGTFFGSAFKGIGASIYGLVVGSFRATVETWSQFPALFGDLFVQGVNAAITSLQWLVNKAVDAVNLLGGDLGHVDFGHVQNKWAGAARSVGQAWASNLDSAVKEGLAGIDGFMDRWAANTASAARSRINDQADGLSLDRRTREADAAAKKAHDEAIKRAKEEAEVKKHLADDLVQNEWKQREDLEKRMDGWNKLDVTKGLKADLKDIGDYLAARGPMAELDRQAKALADRFDEIAQRAGAAASAMREAFGHVGGAIGDATALLIKYGAEQAKIDASTAEIADRRKATTNLQLDTALGLTRAVRGLFAEHSKGARAAEAAEKALAVVQLARTAVAVAEGAAQMFAALGPGGFVAVAAMLGVMAAVGFSGGGGSSSYQPQPANSGKGSVLGDTDAQSASIQRSIDALKDVDDSTLGVSRDMLISLRAIQNSIGTVAARVAQQLGVPGGAFDTGGLGLGKSTSSGDGKSTGLAFLVGGLSGGAGLVAAGAYQIVRQVPIIGDLLGGISKALFGTKTTVSLLDQGLQFANASVADILTNGLMGSTFQDVQTTKKKKLFGISTGSSTSVNTIGGDLDDDLERQIGLLVGGFRSSIVGAGTLLGQDVAGALDAFQVEIGRVSLKDLKGDEIAEALNAVFSKLGDDMALAALPGIERFERVGEGAFETLVRVASTVEQVDATFRRLGATTGSLGVDIDMAISGMFDSVSDFTGAANAYFEAYYSEEEQAAAKTAQLARAFGGLGVTMPETIAGYRQLVEAQDLSSAAGQQMYVTLLQLAPAFAELKAVADDARSAADILGERRDLERQMLSLQGDTATLRALDLAKLDASNRSLQVNIWALQDQQTAAAAAAESVSEAGRVAEQAAAQQLAAEQALASERAGLTRTLLQLQGDTAALRALELAGLNESNRGLQQQIYALQDAQDAAKAADALRDAWKSVGDTIMDEVRRIRGLTDAAKGGSFTSLLGQFNAANSAARGGDLDAAKNLPELSKAVLEAAELAATSQQELMRVQAQTAASLEDTLAMIGGATGSEDLAAWFASVAAQSGSSAGNDNGLAAELRALRTEVVQMRADMNTGNAAIAGNTGRAARILDNVTSESGGNAVATVAA